MQQVDLTKETRGIITLLSITIAFLFGYILYDCFISKTPIEIEVKKGVYNEIKIEKFKDTNWVANEYQLHTFITVNNAKPFVRFTCNTDLTSPYNAMVCILYLTIVLIIAIKLNKKGLFNAQIYKHIEILSYLVLLSSTIMIIQNQFLRNYVNKNTTYLTSAYQPIGLYYFYPSFLLLIWLSKLYKKAFELKKEQDLTI